MFSTRACCSSVAALLLLMCAVPSFAQSFRVQCPFTTPSHPTALAPGVGEPAYTKPTYTGQNSTSTGAVNGAIKCQQISGGDGYATMANGVQTYLFAFGPLSGLADVKAGLPGTELASVFNTVGDPRTDPTYNGAVGLAPDPDAGGALTGHVDPRPIMDIGVMNGNQPAPMMAIDEDDEFFLTLTNVGMIMRPDLFEKHTVHFHGYPNASSFYDGVPDASVAINIGASFTYYYLAPDAGTYFWHCHITPPEHLQMGMVGQIYVRPRQDRVPKGVSLYEALVTQQSDLRTRCGNDILCSTPLPPQNNGLVRAANANIPATTPETLSLYAYNDGDGSTAYDVEYPIQIHGFDPNFHFVGMTLDRKSVV